MQTKEIKGKYYSAVFDDNDDCWYINDDLDRPLFSITKSGESVIFYYTICNILTDIGDVEDIFNLIITVNNCMR